MSAKQTPSLCGLRATATIKDYIAGKSTNECEIKVSGVIRETSVADDGTLYLYLVDGGKIRRIRWDNQTLVIE